MKVIKTKLEAIKIKSFVTAIEQEKMLTMKAGSSLDSLDGGCFEISDPTTRFHLR